MGKIRRFLRELVDEAQWQAMSKQGFSSGMKNMRRKAEEYREFEAGEERDQ